MASKKRRVVLYARVSLKRQDIELQLDELRKVAEDRGWEVVGTLTDNGISGKKGREHRPGLEALLIGATRGEYDLVMAYKLDRIGRSTVDVLRTLQHLQEVGVELYIHDMAGGTVDTSTAMGRFFMSIAAAFGELETDMRKERTLLGQDKARRQGKHMGRFSIETTDPEKVLGVLKLRAKGMGYHPLSAATGIGKSTLQRLFKEHGDPKSAPEADMKPFYRELRRRQAVIEQKERDEQRLENMEAQPDN